MNKNFFTAEEEKNYKAAHTDTLMFELYNLRREVAYSVMLIQDKQAENVAWAMAIDKLAAKLPPEEENIKPKRKSKGEPSHTGIIKQEMAGFQFKIRQNDNSIAKLYEEIAQKGHGILAIQKNVAFIRTLALDTVPQLPYLIINGTKYQAKDNMPVKDENGTMILFIEHGKENAA